MNHLNNNWLFFINKKLKKKSDILNEIQFFSLKVKQHNLINSNPLFLKLIQYNIRKGLKIKTLNLFLKLIQIYRKLFKIMSRRRRRRIRRKVFFRNFERYFQKMLIIRQLFLTKKLTRKKGRRKNYEYKFIVLFKNKRLSHLFKWLRLLSYEYNSRTYLSRLLSIYFDFLFFRQNSYVYKLHKYLRREYYIQKKKKRKLIFYVKKKPYLGIINSI